MLQCRFLVSLSVWNLEVLLSDISPWTSLSCKFFFSNYYFKFYLFLGAQHVVFFVPWPGTELVSPALEVWSLNHWLAMEIQSCKILKDFDILKTGQNIKNCFLDINLIICSFVLKGIRICHANSMPLWHKNCFDWVNWKKDTGRFLCPPYICLKAGHKFSFMEMA